ncbi:hypothetical protein [Rhizobium leguminosarum]|uniref:hypothetical protein n=1 Tax=Rhizobium leguminosarum TaxID=384 RepID=UPI00103CDF83|nr:hypothetical protein [Rhizobium leguminosarum]TBY42266.1 hypothetical protein E0H54_29490 [Rhizobium leguminosarum bv. viciae]
MSDIAKFVGFCAGCAFATYVIRVLGYFSIMGQQFTGIFLEANLLQGAILATPGVVGIASLFCLSVWLGSVMIHFDDQITYVANRISFAGKVKPRTIMNWFSLALLACLFIPNRYLAGDHFEFRLLLSVLIAFLQYLFLFERWVDSSEVSVFLLAYCLIATYTALYDIGKFEAIHDLNHGENGYSITATDKNYVNVTLLRTSSSSILFKAGSSILLYDRAKISKIERMTDKIEQQ